MNEISRDFVGYLNINKPEGPSSFSIVRDITRMVCEKRVGHAGTLDPLASGVLVIAVGRAYTKNIDAIQSQNKTYIATIRLGQSTKTDDREGDPVSHDIDKIPTTSVINDCLKSFIGEIDQLPPSYSAKKIDGQRAYKLARENQSVKLAPCKVTIYRIKLIKYKWPDLEIEVECSKGTYIRSLSRDIGEHLKTGAYLLKLIRTAVGEYKIEDSITL